MNEVSCRKCGEPYSIYSLKNEIPEWDDQPEDAHDKFMSGEGCPTCNWGEKAGEVSRSRTESPEETEARSLREMMMNTEDDPIKFL